MKLSLWPTPFYYQFAEDLESFDSEPCLIIANDGQEFFGDLTRFSPEEGVFKIQPFSGGISRLKAESVNYLRLLHPVHLIKNLELVDEKHEEVFGASDTQHCSIVFTNDKRLDGETVGFAIDKTGLYLYLVHTDDTVIRCFIPSVSIKHYQLGKKIGQMLIEEKIATHQEINSGLERQEQMRTQRLGEYLTSEQIVTTEQLVEALGRQSGTVLKLGDMLVKENLITPEILQEALARQRTDKKVALGEILINMGVVNTEVVQSMLAKKLGIPFVNVKKFHINPDTYHLVPASFINKYSILPLYHTDHTLIVAMENPMIWEPLNELRVITHLTVVPVLAAREDINWVINSLRGTRDSTQKIDELAVGMTFDFDMATEPHEDAIAETDNTLVGLVNKMMLDAYDQGASDIHIETYAGKRNTQIRFRRDGAISKYFEFPSTFRNALISRIKIMARMDISEKRRPQDGKIELKLSQDEKIELRVTTVPTANGLEDIVMRVLASAKPIPLEQLGLPDDIMGKIKQLAIKPYGLFLICGPTGSGKTTTLHSVLGYINTPDRKIWTAEDPIEITQEGLRQVQVNANLGWTFAAAMRSFLRADPDVIMVGEMRDAETAKIAIQASLTGHMVFSTLHTNSAAESMVRLLDLGMDPFNFSDALAGVLAQRLTRRYCSCKQVYTVSDEEIHALADEYCVGTPLNPEDILRQWREKYGDRSGEITLYAAKGCEACEETGYKGRMGLYELLEVTAPVKKLIQRRATVDEIQREAILEGLRTLKQAGIELVLQGQTNILQVRFVCN